ncbi:MAG TPA: BTAD domain-containing putative transcriptional regulator [Pseudonocardia sp.]|nr:BTAD domain-containing putative transcriptional regulator [Pseudonocardia sp.]
MGTGGCESATRGESATRAGRALRVELLGPLRLDVDGAAVDVPGPLRRALLAVLATAGGEAVAATRLVGLLWPGEPPDQPEQALFSHVSRLRRHLGPAAGRLERTPAGYRLRLGPGELDVTEARELARRLHAVQATDPEAAGRLAAQALALWRGPALAEFSDVTELAAEAVALAELHRGLQEARVEAGLTADPAAGWVEEAARLVAADPLRERAVLLLVRALAAAGRAADALAEARAFRLRYGEQTGLEPSPALAALERAVAGGELAQVVPTPARPGPPVPRPSLPRPATALVGREAELAELRAWLGADRLVTVVGTGGVGKTRLALEAAAEAGPPHTAMLALAPVGDPGDVPAALAAALGLPLATPGGPRLLHECAEHLATGPALLLLDNCEHVLDAARDLAATLLERCPELVVLATGREPLALPAERVLRLGPLPLEVRPGTDELPAAVALFLDRAGRQRPLPPGPRTRRDAAAIVRRLDGLPLAIELAAGRLATFTLSDLHDRLDRAIDLLAGGRGTADTRHRRLRDTLAWSYDLLSPDEQRLLRHLCAFADGADLPTVEFVARHLRLPADAGLLLARLVETSLVDADLAGRARYRMLATTRAFAADRLAAADERAESAAVVGAWVRDVAARVDTDRRGPAEPEADRLLRRELATLRAARHLLLDAGDVDAVVALLLAVDEPAAWRDLPEVWDWAAALAADPRVAAHPRRAAVLGAAARGAWLRGELAEAERLARVGLAGAVDVQAVRRCRDALATVALFRGDPGTAREHWLAIAADATDPVDAAVDTAGAALAAAYGGDRRAGRELAGASIAAAGAAGAPGALAFARYVAGEAEDDPAAAEEHLAAAVALARTAGATFVEMVATVSLVGLHRAAGRHREAAQGYRALLAYWNRTGGWTQQWTTVRNAAALLAERDEPRTALLLLEAAAGAPEAAALAADDPAHHLGRDLAARLGADAAAGVRAQARATDRQRLVETALAHLDRMAARLP